MATCLVCRRVRVCVLITSGDGISFCEICYSKDLNYQKDFSTRVDLLQQLPHQKSLIVGGRVPYERDGSLQHWFATASISFAGVNHNIVIR